MSENESAKKIRASALMEDQKKIVERLQKAIVENNATIDESLSKTLLNAIQGLSMLEDLRKAGQ